MMGDDKYGLKKVARRRLKMQKTSRENPSKAGRAMMRNPLKKGNRMTSEQMDAMSKRVTGRAY